MLVVQLDTHNTTEVIVKPELSPLGLWRNATATTLLGSDTGNLVAIDLKTGAHCNPSAYPSPSPADPLCCLRSAGATRVVVPTIPGIPAQAGLLIDGPNNMAYVAVINFEQNNLVAIDLLSGKVTNSFPLVDSVRFLAYYPTLAPPA